MFSVRSAQSPPDRLAVVGTSSGRGGGVGNGSRQPAAVSRRRGGRVSDDDVGDDDSDHRDPLSTQPGSDGSGGGADGEGGSGGGGDGPGGNGGVSDPGGGDPGGGGGSGPPSNAVVDDHQLIVELEETGEDIVTTLQQVSNFNLKIKCHAVCIT